MRQFFEGYFEIGQTVSALMSALPEGFWGISFSHHILLISRCKLAKERLYYIEKAASEFWSFRTLEHHVEAKLFKHQGKLANNFKRVLPENLKADALEVFKDEYLFDFVAADDCDEKVLEGKLVADIKNMIMTLGKGFCFIGNQYRLEVEEEEFFVDLLFFNRHLRCLVAFELKRGKFLPAYDKAMGVATYRTTKEMPRQMRGILPDVAEMVKSSKAAPKEPQTPLSSSRS